MQTKNKKRRTKMQEWKWMLTNSCSDREWAVTFFAERSSGSPTVDRVMFSITEAARRRQRKETHKHTNLVRRAHACRSIAPKGLVCCTSALPVSLLLATKRYVQSALMHLLCLDRHNMPILLCYLHFIFRFFLLFSENGWTSKRADRCLPSDSARLELKSVSHG